MSAIAEATHTGRIVQVIGSTFDAEFTGGHLPEIYHALRVESEVKGVKVKLTGEVQQQLGGSRVRCVALGSTDGLARGMTVIDTGACDAVSHQSHSSMRRNPARRARRPLPSGVTMAGSNRRAMWRRLPMSQWS